MPLRKHATRPESAPACGASLPPMSTSTETVKAACPHDCPDTCAMEVTVEQRGGRRVAVKVAGSAAHAPTQGVLCTKVSRYLERTYHPERVLQPLKRYTLKGSM